MTRLGLAATLVCTWLVAACGEGPGADAAPADADLRDCTDSAVVHATIISQNSTCTRSACHDDSSPAGGLDLLSPNFEQRLIDVAALSIGCQDLTLVVPGDPASSFLLQKLEPSPPCGGQMPRAAPALSAADLACVETWIESLPAARVGQ